MIEEIRKRDAASAETWFKQPALGACGQAFIDRRWLISEVNRLRSSLIAYGRHSRDCGMWPDDDPAGGPCCCGLDALLAEILIDRAGRR